MFTRLQFLFDILTAANDAYSKATKEKAHFLHGELRTNISKETSNCKQTVSGVRTFYIKLNKRTKGEFPYYTT